MEDAYGRLSAYHSDLTHRMGLLEEWKERHPDHLGPQFEDDENLWEKYLLLQTYASRGGKNTIDPPANPSGSFTSSFDPEDPKPNVHDVITVERFCDLVQVALEARAMAKALLVHGGEVVG